MQYRIDKKRLLDIISIWNGYLKRKVCIVACGGTALTLLNIKESTKDIDFIIPNIKEYNYLLNILKDLGYKQATGTGWAKDEGFIFDLFMGNNIFTTGLLESPLKKGNNIKLKEFSNIYLGCLNYYDLLISKIFRYSPVDIEDCLLLFKSKKKDIDMEKFQKRFSETSSYDISEEKHKKNFKHFLSLLKR